MSFGYLKTMIIGTCLFQNLIKLYKLNVGGIDLFSGKLQIKIKLPVLWTPNVNTVGIINILGRQNKLINKFSQPHYVAVIS